MNWKRKVSDLTERAGPAVDGQAFGLEVELENVLNPYGHLENLLVVDDGSLRNHGMEFLTRPQNLEDTKRDVRALYKVMAREGWVSSQRCGIHVHMDMSPRTLSQLHAVLVGYACVEPVLFSLCGAEREANIFCVPWYRAPGDLEFVRDFVYSGTKTKIILLRQLQKYTSLYVEPLRRFNTLEFRGAPVFETAEEVITLLDNLNDWLQNTQDLDAEDLLDVFLEDPAAGLAMVLPRCAGQHGLIEQANSVSTAMRLIRIKPGTEWMAYGVPDDLPAEAFRAEGRRVRRNRMGVDPMMEIGLMMPGAPQFGQPARRRR